MKLRLDILMLLQSGKDDALQDKISQMQGLLKLKDITAGKGVNIYHVRIFCFQSHMEPCTAAADMDSDS